MDDHAFRLNPVTLRFANAHAEAAYAAEHARKSLRPIRIGLIAAAILLVAMAMLATHVFPELLHSGLDANRLLAQIAYFCGTLFALSYTPLLLRWQQWTMLVVVTVMSASVIFVTLQMPLELVQSRGYLGIVLHLFTIYSVFRLRFPQAVLAASLTLALYFAAFMGMGLIAEHDVARHAAALGIANAWGMLICYQMDAAARGEFAALSQLGEERERSERLLLNILPASIAERLKGSDAAIADHSEAVTVLFADIVGFTPLSARKTPQALVAMLNRIFSEFDMLAESNGLEKIKTIGDSYMAVSGLPDYRNDHAHAAATMALGMLRAIERISAEMGETLAVRIGLHSGPVVAGVIGRKKFSYDLWGDTVNTASRMESHGIAGMIQCTAVTEEMLRGAFPLSPRGPIEVEGKGTVATYLMK